MNTTFTAHITTDGAVLSPSPFGFGKFAITVLQNNAEAVLDTTGHLLFTAPPKDIKADACRILDRQGWTVASSWTATSSGFQATVTAS